MLAPHPNPLPASGRGSVAGEATLSIQTSDFRLTASSAAIRDREQQARRRGVCEEAPLAVGELAFRRGDTAAAGDDRAFRAHRTGLRSDGADQADLELQ